MKKFLFIIISGLFTVLLLSIAALFALFEYYGRDLPDYQQLKNYSPPIISRLYAADGRLMEEYAKEKRIFLPIDAIPDRVIDAFLAAEDRNFYRHSGVDFLSIARAIFQNVLNIGQNKNLIGGSTITQQVVKNFLLTNKRSIDRKIKEAILAFRITKAISKNRILELYLNEIFLGNGSYGIAAAALNYFNKSINELSIEEAALLAALPKAPSSFDPVKNPERARERRDWVINGMSEEGFISSEEAKLAIKTPIMLVKRDRAEIVGADYFAEEVRRQLVKDFGEKALYEDGLTVRTTLDPELQKQAEAALKEGILSYDARHGFRGPIKNLNLSEEWFEDLAKIKPPAMFREWQIAVVLSSSKEKVDIGFVNGSRGIIRLENLKWARKYINPGFIGEPVLAASAVLNKGDVIAVEKIADKMSEYSLRQVPQINGAIVVQNPHTGKITALSGGFSFDGSKFNRATQAKRQPGSAFKPFAYLAALENGFTPASIVEDAPIELDQGPGLPKWAPKNYSNEFYGPTTLRIGLEHSRNLITVRLAVQVGVEKIAAMARRFRIKEDAPPVYSTALGATETTLLDLVNAYSMLVNGGRDSSPIFIEKIQDRNGRTIIKSDKRDCIKCNISSLLDLTIVAPPNLPDDRKMVADPKAVYQIISMLEGVVLRGTAVRAREIGKTLGGKTGTTNDSYDAWFVGFTPDLVVGVYMGFDKPATLGEKETGASVALPVFISFMKAALNDISDKPFRIPPGIKMIRIDRKTGTVPGSSTLAKDIIFEAFRNDESPPEYRAPADDSYSGSTVKIPESSEPALSGTGGLY